MNIIYSLCGNGQRFKDKGYNTIKYLIKYGNAPMLYHSVNTLGISGNLHFIVRDIHLKEYKFLEKFLLDLGGKITICYKETSGAAESLLLCENDIENKDLPFISVNSDQYMNWNAKPFIKKLIENPDTSYTLTFQSTDPKCSYVRLLNDKIVEVREKLVISNQATVGVYHWKTSKDFFIDAKQMINDNVRDNNEFYVAPVYNFSIKRGLVVKPYEINPDNFMPVGTPYDLVNFMAEQRFFD